MAGTMDLSRLRDQTMGSGADEEAVTVNTRALIDKVLARYSGDWTTLRELIQNAADASAKNVVIKFETLPSRSVPVPSAADGSGLLKHVLLNHTLRRLTVTNDGQPFEPSDWSRLKRIAEGNPDETKIGAFGVGFYSVFADCETPFVVSGKETMAFYWKGNSLFTRTGRLPDDVPATKTCFMLDYRNTSSPVPDLLSICHFLSTSITFVGLESIGLWLDDWNLLALKKKSAPSVDVALPRNIKAKTKEGMMKVTGVVHQGTQIDAHWMNIVGWTPAKQTASATQEEPAAAVPSLKSFFSRLTGGSTGSNAAAMKAAKEREDEAAVQREIAEDLSGHSKATVFLRISTVNIQTFVSSTFAKELERATKKPPPKQTSIAILTSSHDETSASLSTVSGAAAKKAADIFASVLPTKNGRIFIGFPTAQTTGLLCHISAPSVIPTVERESIDLNARYVRTWNMEMLRVAGIACRIAYGGEMAELKYKLNRATSLSGNGTLTAADVASVTPNAVHVFRQYTSHESTPSSQVGKLIEEAFWECSESASIDALSTKGVLPSHQVRLVSEHLSFLGDTPIVPEDLATGAHEFVRKLYDRGLLTDMTVQDIKKGLESRSLDEAQLMEFLRWAGIQISSEQLDQLTVQDLLNATVATITAGATTGTKVTGNAATDGRVLVLGEIKHFLNVAKIPAEIVVPSSTIPFRFTKNIPRSQLEAFGWEELQIVPWVRFLVEGATSGALPRQSNITTSPEFAARVLVVLSKQWDSLSQSSKTTLVELLSARTVIPTKLGMRRPPDAYFTSVKLFDDLPTTASLQGVKEKFLAALGVRKTVELTVVFDRLMARSSNPGVDSGAKWSFMDLIHYLVSVRDDIPPKDLDRLRNTAICPVESGHSFTGDTGRLYKVSDIFEPKDELRALGLPTLKWSGAWRQSSGEARLLSSLGLKAYPSVPELVQIMQRAALNKDFKLYASALNYFTDFHHINGYAKFDLSKIRPLAFLPAEGREFPQLVAPAACFTNERAAVMGYTILQLGLRPHALKFGVAPDPPIHDSANRLVDSPPRSYTQAVEVFSYLVGRLAEINGKIAETLGNANIVPIIKGREARLVRFTSPRMCFLGDSQTYGDILDFVNFGPEANSFLLKVGSKHEPSSLELARMVVDNPTRILGKLEQDKYSDLLRKLAENQTNLKTDKDLWKEMKQAQFLLAYQDVLPKAVKDVKDPEKASLDELFPEDDEPATKEWSLAKAPNIVVLDSVQHFMHFREHLRVAPQDEVLENFYIALGVPLLSSLVDIDERVGTILRDQDVAQKLQRLVVERSRVFLHEYSPDRIHHDAKWLEKNLTVKLTQSVTLYMSLRGYSVALSEKRTAAILRDSKKNFVLCVTTKYDLFEVAEQLLRLLLKRPKQHDIIALEMILGSDLRRLRAKGYNVDRILRQQAYVSRLAEDERQRQLAEEEVQKAKKTRTPKVSATPQSNGTHVASGDDAVSSGRLPDMPEAFGTDSPDRPMPGGWESPEQPKRGKTSSFLSNITKNLGFVDRPNNQLTNAPTIPGGVTSEQSIHQNLVSAIQSCRSHNSPSVFSNPSTQTVEEAKGSYCDTRPGQDITFVADSDAGVKVYLAKHLASDSSFLSRNMRGINTFAYILLDLGSVFQIPPQSLHIFYDDRTSTIAFNMSGALFCNYHFFSQLHHAGFESGDREKKIDTVSYWWVTLCHELAHNLVSEHSAQHSFYAESFAQQYFSRVMSKALQY